MKAALVAAVICCSLVVARADDGRAALRDKDGPERIVQLGDSIAAGEGTLYGYEYDRATRTWTGGNLDAVWPPPYPLCHNSQYAYGERVARRLDATFHQFACTGATFDLGISAAETYSGTTYRPAQFGDWDTKQELNEEYDQAKPDLVLVTLGADDVQFDPIVRSCIENAQEFAAKAVDAKECVPGNPGPTIQTDYLDFLPQLRSHYRTLVSWIKDRAKADGVPTPKIVFTTYANPLPPKGVNCPDADYLDGDQVQYLASLLRRLNRIIIKTVDGLHDDRVAVANIQDAYTFKGVDHRWCSDDPWTYGLSIFQLSDPASLTSQAPFHPTPRGQRAIADLVRPVILRLFGATQQ